MLLLEEIENNISRHISQHVSYQNKPLSLNYKMFKTLFGVILSLLLSTGTCDLIGFNRLGNNVGRHVQRQHSISMETLFAHADYRVQYRNWMLENNLEISDETTFLQDISTEQHKPSNYRLNRYKRRMASI